MCYKKHDNGSSIMVYGLECQLPPYGMGVHTVTGELAPVDIIKRSKKSADQYWEAPKLPEDFEKLSREEEHKQRKDPDFENPDLQKIREREWHRRLHGVWFWNNGAPVYLTGLNYFFLTYWYMDTGELPVFRIVDLEYFYFWAYCVGDPRCYGMIEVRKRRDGKTARPTCTLYETISRTRRALGGIQSKTEPDAKKVFKKHLIPAWKKMPSFFRPKFETQGGTDPEKELKFSVSVKGKDALTQLDDPEQLQSVIDYRSSNPLAYDGDKLIVGLFDESGKTETDIMDRHSVLKKCFVDYKRAIIGKMVVTSTVEEIGVKFKFKELWEGSNQFKREEDGTTGTGLYKFFVPADRTGAPDKYGYCDVEETRKQILADREKHRHNVSLYIAEIRKEPLTEEEAFRTSSKNGHYDDILIGDQIDNLAYKYEKDFWVRGNFIWKDGIRDTTVIWEPSSKGRWVRCWNFSDLKDTNQIEKRGNFFHPLNKMRFVSGCDPVDHNKVENDGRKSKACSYILKRHDPGLPEDDHFNKAFVCEYYARPDYSELFYEDMIMQCVYFGCPILVETQKPKIKDHFKNRGYGAFLIHLPGYQEEGIPSTPANKLTMVEVTEAYIVKHSKKVYYTELLSDWIIFDVSQTEKFDRSMAAGWTLIADMSYAVKKDIGEIKDINNYMRMYSIKAS